jgi:glycosyltransferase involved in cell wall biosynthesis
MGEGWDLIAIESMAAGLPQIVPRYAALAEWPNGAVQYMELDRVPFHNPQINTVGRVPEYDSALNALETVYSSEHYRKELSNRGRTVALLNDYRWENVAEKFNSLFNNVLSGKEITGNE